MALSDNARDFWVVAGTAAPIIALANQVVVSDSGGLMPFFDRATWYDQPPDVKSHGRRGQRYAVTLYTISAFNLLFQIFGLTAALTTLNGGSVRLSSSWVMTTGITPATVVVTETVGLLLLLVTSIMSGVARGEAAQIRALTRSLSAPEQAAAAITATLDKWQFSQAPDTKTEPPV
jgi:hypothetical protein